MKLTFDALHLMYGRRILLSLSDVEIIHIYVGSIYVVLCVLLCETVASTLHKSAKT